ncbi:hypothetical protein BGZ68_007369 [Mortierella alpina]|nr:hypothetical protein BGZ68_007369 [Mortierella alpina]
MSCDLTDPAIQEAYQAITNGTPTNCQGTGGLAEFRTKLSDEVLYGFVRVQDQYALIAYVSEQVSGLRRARALVHGKAVGAHFKVSHIQINTSNLAELADDKIRARLGIVESPPTPDPSSSPSRPSSPTAVAVPRPVTPVSPSTPTGYQNATDVSSPVRSGTPLSGPTTPRIERQLEIEAAERKIREEMERQKRAEMMKRQRETQEREAIEQELLAQKQAQELERKRKEESARVAREAMKKQLIEMEKLRGSGLSGYITIQSAGSAYWRRRFYVMRGQNVMFFRDENDRQPVSEMKLGGRVTNIEDASLDCLIPNSFRVDLYMGEPHFFFSDTTKDKELAIAGFMKCNESA